MKYNLRRQDIHLKDRPLWENIKESWQQKNYSEAIKEVKSSQLKTKASVASSLNEIVDYLEKVQNDDDKDFKNDLIPVSKNEPLGLKIGQIWFKTDKEKIAPYTFAQVTQKNMTFAQITALNIIWETVNKGGW